MIPAQALVISEDTDTAEIWRYILGRKGIETTLAVPPEEDDTEHRPEISHDIIMIDICSPPVNVANFIRRLLSDTTAPILVFLPNVDEPCVLETYNAGADEVIIKPINHRLFVAKVHAWIRRSYIAPTSMLESFESGDMRLNTTQRQLVTESGKAIKLTNLEFRLAHLLMSHPGQVLQSSIIVNRLWGAYGVGDNVLLKNVVYRLRRKIEPDPADPRYIQVAAGEGYMFTPQQSDRV
jgi:DNA-binding response OmpR family regulator